MTARPFLWRSLVRRLGPGGRARDRGLVADSFVLVGAGVCIAGASSRAEMLDGHSFQDIWAVFQYSFASFESGWQTPVMHLH